MNNPQSKEQNILPKSQFLNFLRIEKRRVDRSKANLSLVLFYFHKKEEKGNTIHEFIPTLQKNSRESDIKGWVDRDVIGLILPDTDENGVKRFVTKIAEANGGFNYSVTTGTYPDHLFVKLLMEGEGLTDFYPLDLDAPIESYRLQVGLKRGLDILGSLVGLILFSPIMLAIAIAIKMTSPGPVIFKQPRFGKKGARFEFYKFRSMYWNTDDRIHREYVTNLIKGDLEKVNQRDKGTPLFKMVSDPRVTSVGKIIRKTSMDELPQFFNVLMGEMSLVGPRPPLSYEIQKYEAWHLRRILEVKPGITGLWQVEGRSTTSFDDMVRLDLRYAQNWSLWLDIKILLRTVKAVLIPKGAW